MIALDTLLCLELARGPYISPTSVIKGNKDKINPDATLKICRPTFQRVTIVRIYEYRRHDSIPEFTPLHAF